MPVPGFSCSKSLTSGKPSGVVVGITSVSSVPSTPESSIFSLVFLHQFFRVSEVLQSVPAVPFGELSSPPNEILDDWTTPSALGPFWSRRAVSEDL